MKVKNPISQNIRIFPKINQKRICQTEKFKFKYVHLCTQYLVGAPLASVRCGMEAISLWHC